MKAWLRQHRHALASAARRLVKQPLASFLSVLVIGIAVSLPAGLYTMLTNLSQFTGQLNAEPRISLFLSLNAGNSDVTQLQAKLKAHPLVGGFQFVSREQALTDLKAVSGMADMLDSLERNPLPHAFLIQANNLSAEALEKLRDELAMWPKVDHVQVDTAWAKKLASFTNLARKLIAMLAALLALALAAVTGNTIRLQVLAQRDEIEVGRLIGATDAYIRRPHLYFGALQGIAGGLCALALVNGAMQWLQGGLMDLFNLYTTGLHILPLNLIAQLTIMAVSALLGWLGAYGSVALYLRQIK